MLDRIDGNKSSTQVSQVRNPQEGKAVTIGAMRITLKATGAETDGRFALLEVTVPPYFSEIVLHLHRQSSEAIYLTQGMLAVTLGEETMVVRQGSCILIPPHQIHRFWNPAASAATFLVYFTPAGPEEFFEALAGREWGENSHSLEALAEVWAMGMTFDYFPMEG